MNHQAGGDRSVVAHNVHQTVIVTGDQNTVALTIIEAAPRAPSLLPGREALAGQLDASRLFHHGHPLVGRDVELAALVAAVRDPGRRVVVLPAPGGAGKTRLLLELDDCLTDEGITVLWVAEPPLDATALAEIPVGPAVVIVDDVHAGSTCPLCSTISHHGRTSPLWPLPVPMDGGRCRWRQGRPATTTPLC